MMTARKPETPLMRAERPGAIRFVNDGAPAMSSLAELRPGEGFAPAERLAKINDRNHGLFALVDGKEARTPEDAQYVGLALAERLGAELTRSIDNILASKAHDKPRLAETLLTDALLSAVQDADEYASRRGSRASALVMKQVEFAPGKPMLAYVNVGGNRLYRVRGSKIEVLAEAQTELEEQVREGKTTADQARLQDEDAHPSAAARRLAHALGLRAEARVRFEPLRPGDRLIALSPAAGNALLAENIAGLLERLPAAERAERALQLAAIDAARQPGQARTERGDVAAVVVDVPGTVAPERPEKSGMTREDRLVRLNVLNRELDDLATAAREHPTPSLERLQTQKKNLMAEHELAVLREDVPPRYGIGDRVRVSGDGLRQVVGYDGASDRYEIQDPLRGPAHRTFLNRFELESQQSKEMLPLRRGDVFPYRLAEGKPLEDWRVVDGAPDANGTIFIADPRGSTHERVSAKEVRALVHQRIAFGRGALKTLHATRRLLDREAKNAA